MRVIDIENITDAMRDDTRFVLRCEETESAATEEKPGGWPEEKDEW